MFLAIFSSFLLSLVVTTAIACTPPTLPLQTSSFPLHGRCTVGGATDTSSLSQEPAYLKRCGYRKDRSTLETQGETAYAFKSKKSMSLTQIRNPLNSDTSNSGLLNKLAGSIRCRCGLWTSKILLS